MAAAASSRRGKSPIANSTATLQPVRKNGPWHDDVQAAGKVVPIRTKPAKKGSKSMINARLGRFALVLALLTVAAFTPKTASAWTHYDDLWMTDLAAGYTVPIQLVYQFPGVIVDQPTAPWGYTYPIQNIYQFPAVIANQPGSEVPFLWSNPARGLLGGRPYLYHH
jgi:hypothetical protein